MHSHVVEDVFKEAFALTFVLDRHTDHGIGVPFIIIDFLYERSFHRTLQADLTKVRSGLSKICLIFFQNIRIFNQAARLEIVNLN